MRAVADEETTQSVDDRRLPDGDPARWPPWDESLLWHLSSEYAQLFATKRVDEEDPHGGEKPSWREGALLLLGSSGTLLLMAALLVTILLSTSISDAWALAVRVAITLLVGIATLIGARAGQKYLSARNAFYTRVRWIKAREVEQALDDLHGGLSLEKLFALNRKQLDEYHVMSVRQAASSFRNATVTSLVGFATLIAGAVISLQQSAPSDTYVAAGLAGLGAALTTFISRNFFTSWRVTREQLREYYAEPARTSKLLGLERLALQHIDGDETRDIPQDLRHMMVTKLLDDFADDARTVRESRPGNGRRSRAAGGAASHATAT